MNSSVSEIAKMGTFRIYEEQMQDSGPEVQNHNSNIIVDSDSKEREIVSQFDCGNNLTQGFCDDNSSSSVSIQIEPHTMKAPDTCSIASTSSLSSSSSSVNVMIDPGKKQHFATQGATTLKVPGPANDNQNRIEPQSQTHSRIRRVPSTANPKYKIPKLGRTQRSHSQPQLQFNSTQSQRRNSTPSNLTFANVHTGNSKSKQQHPSQNQMDHQSNSINFPGQMQPQVQNQQQSKNANSQQQQQQQIIYLQIPQPSQSQMYDSQALQKQISSQLQQLVPQIYSQLLNQIVPSNSSESLDRPIPSPSLVQEDDNFNFNSEVQSQRMMNQIYDTSSNVDHKTSQATPHPTKRQKSNLSQHPVKQSNDNLIQSTEISTQISAEDISKYLQIENISQILQQIPAHILQQNTSSQQTSYIEIQQLPGFPKITIPITQELLLQCQQFQQNRDLGFTPYQPGLETILEESMSVKHLKINRFPKTKIIACILTVLCVIVVVLLAGDKTVAVVVVAVVFIIFLLASIFYLYVNSSKSPMALSHSDSQRIQVSTIATCDKPSSMV